MYHKITYFTSHFLFHYDSRYAKNLRLYFQEYARLIFENEENKVEKEGEKGGKGGKGEKENEYQQVLEGTSSDEKSVSLSMDLDLDSRNKSDDKSTMNIPNENRSIINVKYDEVTESSEGISNKGKSEGKDGLRSIEVMEGKGNCEDGPGEKDGKDGKNRSECTGKKEQQEGKQETGKIVEHSQDIITPHQWQHFEPFFKWLDNPDKLPEV